MKTKIDFTLDCDCERDESDIHFGYWIITWNQKLIATVNNIYGIEQAKNQSTLGSRFLTRLNHR